MASGEDPTQDPSSGPGSDPSSDPSSDPGDGSGRDARSELQKAVEAVGGYVAAREQKLTELIESTAGKLDERTESRYSGTIDRVRAGLHSGVARLAEQRSEDAAEAPRPERRPDRRVDRALVTEWVQRYEQSWRTPGTEHLAELFTEDATYLVSPWASPVAGLAAIERLWDAERDSPDESFTMRSEAVAVDGDTAVVRVEVEYAGPQPARWRDLWVLRFGRDGRCAAFEEWPFAPAQPDGHDSGAGD